MLQEGFTSARIDKDCCYEAQPLTRKRMACFGTWKLKMPTTYF